MTLPELVNYSQLLTAPSIVDQYLLINVWSGSVLLTSLYFVLSIITILGIMSKYPIGIALASGGFMAIVLGIFFVLLNAVPIWAPMFFTAITFIGCFIVIGER